MRGIGDLARLAGVSVRTLRHYDEIGLLVPQERSGAGYRRYGHAELERLQEILVWRQLGFALHEIAELLDDPAHDRLAALLQQRSLVDSERQRLQAVAVALDDAIAAQRRGREQQEERMFADFRPSDYESEAAQRWGQTEAYRESARRARSYGEQEWAQIRSEADRLEADFAALLAAGRPAGADAARDVAERHRRHISHWFYPVSPAMHRGLADMYVADPRFAEHYEQRRPGLAAYVAEAIRANADAVPAPVSR